MTLIPNEIIQEILDRSDIVDVISSSIPLKQAGRNFKALCPFHHEKTPSFIVNPDKQIFHCFGCGAGGNVITFVMSHEHLDFPEAVRLLADKLGITIQTQKAGQREDSQIRQQLFKINKLAVQYFHDNLIFDKSPSAKTAREYLKNRHVNLEIVKKFQLGLALNDWDGLMGFFKKSGVHLTEMEKAGLIIPQNQGGGYYDRFRNRITFPIFDVKSNCIAFGARTLEAENPAKYINSPETMIYTKGKHLYGFHLAKESILKRDFAIVVEGYMDFIMPYQKGVENIVASLGTALTIDQIRLLYRYTKNIVLLFDMDQAGETATLRNLELLMEEDMNVKVAILTKEDDPDSFVRKFGVEKFREQIEKAESFFEFKLKTLMERFDPKSIEGRAKISSGILPFLKKIKNAIIQSEYVKKLAQVLAVSQEAVLIELKKLGPGSMALKLSSDQFHDRILDAEQLRPVERNLLKLMLEEKEFIPSTRSEIKVSDFQNEYIRQIVEKIFELFDQGQEPNLQRLMSYWNDQKILQIVTKIMASEDSLVGDKKRIFRDCIQRLKQDRLKAQRRNLLNQMNEATSTGDHKRLEDLIQQFNQLIKG